MLWLLTGLGWLRKALSALAGLVRSNPSLAAILALALACGWLWHAKGKAIEQRDAAYLQVALWKDAQVAAVRWANAEAKRKDALASDITKGANDVRNQAASLRAGNDYAARNRCMRVTPAKGDRVGSDLPRSVSLAGQPEGAADNAELVAVTRPDFDAATVNSADLLNAYQWGQAMVAAGLAK